MKWIKLEDWARRAHFDYFRRLRYPHFSLCANLDFTTAQAYLKGRGLPVFLSTLYAASRAANELQPFRLRIRGEAVVEHERVAPSYTVMTEQGVFRFLTVPYQLDFSAFLREARSLEERARQAVVVEDEPGEDALLYVTCIPWVSFTSLSHPIDVPVDSVPRLSWGKLFLQGEKTLLPFSVQVHHGLADGADVGAYFELLQQLLDSPEGTFGGTQAVQKQ